MVTVLRFRSEAQWFESYAGDNPAMGVVILLVV